MATIPFYMSLMSKFIPVLETEGNISKGEIVKFDFCESQKNTHKYGDKVTGCSDGHDYIAVHLSDDWFKIIGKWPESKYSCQ